MGHLQWVCESLGILSLLALPVLSHAPCQHSALLFRVVGPSCSGRWPCRRGLPVQASPAFHSLPPCSIMATANHSLCGTSYRSDTGRDSVPSSCALLSVPASLWPQPWKVVPAFECQGSLHFRKWAEGRPSVHSKSMVCHKPPSRCRLQVPTLRARCIG